MPAFIWLHVGDSIKFLAGARRRRMLGAGVPLPDLLALTCAVFKKNLHNELDLALLLVILFIF